MPHVSRLVAGESLPGEILASGFVEEFAQFRRSSASSRAHSPLKFGDEFCHNYFPLFRASQPSIHFSALWMVPIGCGFPGGVSVTV